MRRDLFSMRNRVPIHAGFRLAESDFSRNAEPLLSDSAMFFNSES